MVIIKFTPQSQIHNMAATKLNGECRAPNKSAKAAHVNMMTDTIIANLPPDGLRSILRGLLGIDPRVTEQFHDLAAKYLQGTKLDASRLVFFTRDLSGLEPSEDFFETQRRYRCLMGCGFGFDSIQSLTAVLQQLLLLVRALLFKHEELSSSEFMSVLASIDGDIVQSVTAVQKELLTDSGMRTMVSTEQKVINDLRSVLLLWSQSNHGSELQSAFSRGFSRVEKLQGRPTVPHTNGMAKISQSLTPRNHISETVKLGSLEVPRMFMGLWQFSSPAWGTASKSQIDAHFRKHVEAGFTAYDMADHYGDAEVTFGQFRSSQPDSDQIACATKLCVFGSAEVTPEFIESNVSERTANLDAEKIELLQFHWQDYHDHQYIKAAKLIAENPKVSNFGLCNFDSQRLDEMVESGIKIVSNQVQFSLIDLRPTFIMAASCRKHDVKLLTYGSLCGGFLADKWLGAPAPDLYDKDMTPSHRKYFEMIAVWGGWTLFQELLSILSVIGKKYDASISTAAIRWVLDHDYVGAVIIGARMGVSEHVDENLKVFSFRLDERDQKMIREVLDRCNSNEVFEAMGDCGAEYR